MTFSALLTALLSFQFLFSPILSQYDCPEPDVSAAFRELAALINVFEYAFYLPVHYVCQAQGSSLGSYRSLSIIANYTPIDGNLTTVMFQMSCNSSSWEADLDVGFVTPAPGLINAPTRTDCLWCNNTLVGDRCHGKCHWVLLP